MNGQNLTLAMRLFLDAQRWNTGLKSAGGSFSKFSGGVRHEVSGLASSIRSVQGQLASLGITVGGVAVAVQSANLDKSLTQIGQTAGEGRGQVVGLRSELFRLAQETGQEVDALKTGFNNLIQSGLSWKESLAVIEATNKAMAVTGSQADALTGGLTVAGAAFNFDLSQPGLALNLLDKMVVAGRLGNAELENLSDIFARVGVNANRAGMGFDQTLAFIEGLSLVERQPERLATLADSTLRLFTNKNYREKAEKVTGVSFFNKDQSRRDAMAVLADIKKRYDTLKTDLQRERFIGAAFGSADLDTIKGLSTLLTGDNLSKVGDFSTKIGGAGGALQKDLDEALNNAVDQTGRLKNTLREAADSFAQPINDTLSQLIKFSLDKKESGGLDLSGKEIIGGGLALGIGSLLAARYGGKAISGLANKFGSTAAGVATGKALEEAAGVTPVYVVNMPSGGIGSAGVADLAAGAASGAVGAKVLKTAASWKVGAAMLGGVPLSKLGMLGATGMAGAAGGVAAAGAAGYGVGTLINDHLVSGTWLGDKVGEGVARLLALFGNAEAQAAIEANERAEADVGGTIRLVIDDRTGVRVAGIESNNRNVGYEVSTGSVLGLP